MVTIVGYKTYSREDGSEFYALVVQGGVEAVKSQDTGRTYLTARQAKVACTFDENTCESLIGTTLDGKIKKVQVEPYEYMIPDTGELVTLEHRYEFINEIDDIIDEHVLEEEAVV